MFTWNKFIITNGGDHHGISFQVILRNDRNTRVPCVPKCQSISQINLTSNYLVTDCLIFFRVYWTLLSFLIVVSFFLFSFFFIVICFIHCFTAFTYDKTNYATCFKHKVHYSEQLWLFSLLLRWWGLHKSPSHICLFCFPSPNLEIIYR